jgi:hypothetical protein
MLYLGINQHKRCCLENMQTMRLDLEHDPLPASDNSLVGFGVIFASRRRQRNLWWFLEGSEQRVEAIPRGQLPMSTGRFGL